LPRVQRKHDDLSERDLKIVEMRDNGKYKLREIAEIFGISRQRVLQICDREGCRKLRLVTERI
jgi:DNA-directed RNA polymerase specialized sigma subunit